MNFITFKELDVYIRELPKNQITGSDDGMWDILEAAALVQVQNATGGFYDSDCLYPVILTDKGLTSSQYTPGEYIYDSTDTKFIYQNIATASGTQSFQDTNFYSLDDPRNAWIIEVMIDIMIYNAHARISVSQTPENRILRYEQKLEALKSISNGQAIAGLGTTCLIDSDGDGIPDGYGFGSNPKIDQYF